jgi:hypothetical protein
MEAQEPTPCFHPLLPKKLPCYITGKLKKFIFTGSAKRKAKEISLASMAKRTSGDVLL